jgi:hypothetical protein
MMLVSMAEREQSRALSVRKVTKKTLNLQAFFKICKFAFKDGELL